MISSKKKPILIDLYLGRINSIMHKPTKNRYKCGSKTFTDFSMLGKKKKGK